MRRSAAVALLLAGAFAVASCTGTPALAPGTSEALAQGVAEVRAAVESGNREAAEAALASLRSSIDDFRLNDAISEEKMLDILGAVSEVEAALDVMPTTTTTLPVEGDDFEIDNGGKGKGKGHEKD